MPRRRRRPLHRGSARLPGQRRERGRQRHLRGAQGGRTLGTPHLPCLEKRSLALQALTSRHTNPLLALPGALHLPRLKMCPAYGGSLISRHSNPPLNGQQVRWPAWKCVSYVEVRSHPGTPTLLLALSGAPLPRLEMRLVCGGSLTSRHTNPILALSGALLPRLEMRLVCGGSLTSRHTNPSMQVMKDSYVHSYPFCWRSETPLIYKVRFMKPLSSLYLPSI